MARLVRQVFISATTCDLSSYRRAVAEVVVAHEMLPVVEESFSHGAGTIRELLRARLAPCDAVICLIGTAFGHSPSDQPDRSYTQLEYDMARELDIPRYLFVTGEECALDATPDEADELLALQQRFRAAVVGGDEAWATIATHDRLRADVRGLLLEVAKQEPRPKAEARPNAPHQVTPAPAEFTGRDEQLAEILLKVGQGGAVIYGLRGQGGVGKSTLAYKLAEMLIDRYPGGQIQVDMRGTTEPLDPAEAMRRVIRALRPEAVLPEPLDEVAPLYNDALHERRALILYDNARDAQQVEQLRAPSGNFVLVTTRQAFRVSAFTCFNVDVLRREASVRLLRSICPRIREDADAVARACGDLPLALQMAAGFLLSHEDQSPEDYLARLQCEREHREPVEASLQLSLEMLDRQTHERWCLLSVVRGDFEVGGAAAVWGTSQAKAKHTLSELVRHSLLHWDDQQKRYRLHDLLRLCAEGRCELRQLDEARWRHASHYGRILHRADELYLQGAEHLHEGLRLFDLERANIETAFSWAQSDSARRSATICCEYPDAGAYVLSLRQTPAEGLRWLAAQIRAAEVLQDPQRQAIALGNAGVAYTRAGQPEQAAACFARCLDLARATGNSHWEASSLCNLGLLHAANGRHDRADEVFAQALGLARQIGDKRVEASTLGNVGNAYVQAGRPAEGLKHLRQTLSLARELGDQRMLASTLDNIGLAYAALGRPARAEMYLEQALETARRLGDRAGVANASWNLGLVLAGRGKPDAAVALMQVMVDYQCEIGHPDAAKSLAKLDEIRQGSSGGSSLTK